MGSNKFEYALNAIHYCLWLGNMKLGNFMGRVVNALLAPIPKYLFTKEYKRKYYERLPKERKKLDKFFYGKEAGFHICWAHHWFGYFYSSYPALLSFMLEGLIPRYSLNVNNVTRLALLAIPIGLCYIPAYKAVFTKDKYLKYFKIFEQEDKQWHKKWKRTTVVFCLGSISATILGICMAFIIAIM